LAEEYVALCSYFSIHHVVFREKTKTFQKRLVGESLLESAARILDQAIQDGQSSNLSVHASILAIAG
jgi:hypothetical protein